MISLVEITPQNRGECIALTVAENQKSFVAANIDSLNEADENPGMCPVGIYADNKMVGFAMYGNNEEENKSWIIRYMIDESHQKKGYGKESLKLLIQMMYDKYKSSAIRLCVEPGNTVAINFYKSFGFRSTGETWDGEDIYELKRQSNEPDGR